MSEEHAEKKLIAIPAYNEEATIRGVVENVRNSAVGFDLLIVNDGSRDHTESILKESGVAFVSHACNLGYGRAIETAIQYSLRFDYDVLITLDADGQHQPDQIRSLYEHFKKGNWGMLIGSRHLHPPRYRGYPFGRRMGMFLFSHVVKMMTGTRIYDTSSGFKVIRRDVLDLLSSWRFVDFHAEVIVFLLEMGCAIGEYPIQVKNREHGESMHSLINHFKYPFKTSLLTLISFVEAKLRKRRLLR